MKFKNMFGFLKSLEEKLGSDLVYSLSLDEGKTIITISTHKSTRVKYEHGRNMQSAEIKPQDFKKSTEELANEIEALFKNLLIKTPTESQLINSIRENLQ